MGVPRMRKCPHDRGWLGVRLGQFRQCPRIRPYVLKDAACMPCVSSSTKFPPSCGGECPQPPLLNVRWWWKPKLEPMPASWAPASLERSCLQAPADPFIIVLDCSREIQSCRVTTPHMVALKEKCKLPRMFISVWDSSIHKARWRLK